MTPAMRYCESPYLFKRRKTRENVIGDPRHGGVIIGGDHPVAVQSMITCDTMDTPASVQQTLELVAVGCQIVRITAPTVKDAANLQNIVTELRQRGCRVPIVADIHFKPEAAMEAVKWVEVVRVNPARVRLTVERTSSKAVQVSPTLNGTPKAGFEMEGTTIAPVMVDIEGPESHVQAVKSIATTPIILKGRSATFTETVDLDIQDPVVRVPKATSVKVEVRIRKTNP